MPLVSSCLEANAGYLSFSNNTIPKKNTENADAVTIETTAVDCDERNTIHLMETMAIDKDAGYVTSDF